MRDGRPVRLSGELGHAGRRIRGSLCDGLRPRRLDVEPDGGLRRIRQASLGKRDAQTDGAARIDEFVELEQGCDKRNVLFEKLVAFEFTLSFVSGEQDTTAGLKDPMELTNDGAKFRPTHVDQRVERQKPAESLSREWKRSHVRGHRAVETTVGQSHHLRAEIEPEDAPAALSDEHADLARSASDFDDRIRHRPRERGEELAIAWLVPQLIEKSSLVPARNHVVRRT